MPIIEHGLTELIARMQAYPEKLGQAMRTTMDASLLVLWESVPPYPPQPDGSAYERTGTLGRTLGSGSGGGAGSTEPEIYEVKALGSGGYEGHFGTNLDYAPYVIGDETQAKNNSHWWVIGDVAKRATDKINRLWEILGDNLAKFLEGK